MEEILLLTNKGAFVRETDDGSSYKERPATKKDIERLMGNE